LKFAYATNGAEIIEFDFITGSSAQYLNFPSRMNYGRACARPKNWRMITAAQRLLTAINLSTDKEPRYYQQIAINRAVQAILQGKRRVLLTMATGTGKTVVAFHICWKLWVSKWEPDRWGLLSLALSSKGGEELGGERPRNRAFCILRIAIFWWTTRRTKIFSPCGDLCRTKSKAATWFSVANFISLPTNPSAKDANRSGAVQGICARLL